MIALTARAPAGAAAQAAGPPEPERALLAAWLDRRLLAALLRGGFTPAGGEAPPVLDLPGLSVSADAAYALLRPSDGEADPVRLEAEAEAAWGRLLAGAGVFARLSGLGLDEAALRVLALCLAPDLDGRYGKVYGFLHDDVTRRRASCPLLRQVMGDEAGEAAFPAMAATAPLRRLGLLHVVDGEPASALASLECDPVVLCALEHDLPGDLAPLVRRTGWRGETRSGPGLEGIAEAARRLAEPSGEPRLLRVSSEQRPERRGWAEALLARLGASPLRVEPPDAAPQDQRAAAALGDRLALLAGLERSVPIVDLPPAWLGPEARGAVAALLNRMSAVAPLVLVLTDPAWAEPELPAFGASHHIRLQPPALPARRAAWREFAAARGVPLGPAELEPLAALRLETSQIARAVADARADAWPDGQPDGPALLAAGRRLAALSTPHFARRIPPEAGLDRIVLPPDRHAQLREIVAQVRHAATVQDGWGFRELMLYGRGVAALFAGPSGTGKTASARAIAGELGIDLLQIDLAQVVSKYIGETEKNLSAVFAAAEAAEVALLFDEADALFGKRSDVKDAHDRYANIETAFLLQRLEEFTGLAILTTNLKPNLDTAFLRRLRFVVDFPRPDAALRAEIWRRAFPPRAPLDPDLDLDLLAERLDLTGGSIQGAALRAAYLAAGEDRPIAMRHLVYACRRELLKLGQLSAERELAALAVAWTGGSP